MPEAKEPDLQHNKIHILKMPAGCLFAYIASDRPFRRGGLHFHVSRLTSHFSRLTSHLPFHSTAFLYPFDRFCLTIQSISTTPALLFHYYLSTNEPSVNHSATTQGYFPGSCRILK